jgi:hypothetical protein
LVQQIGQRLAGPGNSTTKQDRCDGGRQNEPEVAVHDLAP